MFLNIQIFAWWTETFFKKAVFSFLKMPSPSKTIVKSQMWFFMSKAQAFHQSSFTFLQFSSDSVKHRISNVLKHTKLCYMDFIRLCLLSRKYTYLQIKFLLLVIRFSWEDIFKCSWFWLGPFFPLLLLQNFLFMVFNRKVVSVIFFPQEKVGCAKTM